MRQQVGPQVGHALGTKAVQVVEDSREAELPKGHLRVVEHRAVARLAVAQLLFEPASPDRQGQLRRVSCRESVCQSGQISVLSGSLQINKTQEGGTRDTEL